MSFAEDFVVVRRRDDGFVTLLAASGGSGAIVVHPDNPKALAALREGDHYRVTFQPTSRKGDPE